MSHVVFSNFHCDLLISYIMLVMFQEEINKLYGKDSEQGKAKLEVYVILYVKI